MRSSASVSLLILLVADAMKSKSVEPVTKPHPTFGVSFQGKKRSRNDLGNGGCTKGLALMREL
jgi:hypothetical protein